MRNRLFTWVPAFAGMSGVLVVGAIAQPADPAAEVFARQTQAVTDRVHLIYKPAVADPPFEGNVVVIEQERGLVVIDAGGSPPSGRAVVAEIRKLSAKPVTALVYTHYHGDHNLGAGAILEAWPAARVISTARTRENMTGPPMDYVKTYDKSYGDLAAFAAGEAAKAELPPTLREGWARAARAGPGMVAGYAGMRVYPATETFTDRLILTDPVAPVELVFLGRANTDGDAIAWLPRQRVIATGDIVVAPVPYAAHTFPTDWLTALDRVSAYDFAYLVPGHGAVQTDRVYLGKVQAALKSVTGQVAPLAKAGTPLDEVRQRIDLAAVRRSFAGDDAWLLNLIDAVFTGDLVSNAYKEARGEPVIQGKG